MARTQNKQQPDVYRFKDRDGKWRERRIEPQPIREIPVRKDSKRKPA